MNFFKICLSSWWALWQCHCPWLDQQNRSKKKRTMACFFSAPSVFCSIELMTLQELRRAPTTFLKATLSRFLSSLDSSTPVSVTAFMEAAMSSYLNQIWINRDHHRLVFSHRHASISVLWNYRNPSIGWFFCPIFNSKPLNLSHGTIQKSGRRYIFWPEDLLIFLIHNLRQVSQKHICSQITSQLARRALPSEPAHPSRRSSWIASGWWHSETGAKFSREQNLWKKGGVAPARLRKPGPAGRRQQLPAPRWWPEEPSVHLQQLAAGLLCLRSVGRQVAGGCGRQGMCLLRQLPVCKTGHPPPSRDWYHQTATFDLHMILKSFVNLIHSIWIIIIASAVSSLQWDKKNHRKPKDENGKSGGINWTCPIFIFTTIFLQYVQKFLLVEIQLKNFVCTLSCSTWVSPRAERATTLQNCLNWPAHWHNIERHHGTLRMQNGSLFLFSTSPNIHPVLGSHHKNSVWKSGQKLSFLNLLDLQSECFQN